MPPTSPDRTIDQLISGGRTIAMIMTMTGGEHTSRPVTCVEVADGRLAFLVNREFHWVEAIATGEALVHVTVADDSDNTYLSLNGTATVGENRDDLQRLWTPAARVWFDGPDDPRLAVIYFDVSSGEYWDGPNGRLGQAIALIRGALTGHEAVVGDQGMVTATTDEETAG